MDHLRVAGLVAVKRGTVQEHLAVNHFDPKRWASLEVALDRLVQLLNFPGDHRMARRVGAGQSAQARKSLEDADRVRERGRRHRASSTLALRETRTRLGLQNQKRNGVRPVRTASRPAGLD